MHQATNPPSSRRSPALLAALGLLLLGASGCGQRKASECNALVQVINVGVQSLEVKPKATEGDGNSGADLKAMADSMDKVAADAGKVELTVPELKKYSTDYQGMVKEVSRALRAMAAATDAKDTGKITDAQAAMEKAVKQEDPVIESINKFCQTP